MRERLPFAVRPALHVFPAAILARAQGETHPELRVGEETNEAIVLLQQRARAGRNVDSEDIEEALVALIVRDQELVGEMMRDLLDEAGHARRRRERQTIAGFQVDAMGLPVLVAPLLTEVHDVTMVVQPYQHGAEIAAGDLRKWPRRLHHAQRAHPNTG